MSAADLVVLDKIVGDQNTSLAPELSPDDFFEVFAIEQLLKDRDLSYDEIEAGIVDGGDDGGVDGVYIFVNGILLDEDEDLPNLGSDIHLDLYLIQAKNQATFKETPITRLRSTIQDLMDLTEDKNLSAYSAAVRSKLAFFKNVFLTLAPKFPTTRIFVVYAAKGDRSSLNPKIEGNADALTNTIRSMYSGSEVRIEFLGASELLALARQQPKTTYSLRLAESPISSGGAVGYVCLVKLGKYFEFITDEERNLQSQIFEANVRDYQGNVEVNTEISASLAAPDEMTDFWWLNNGVTILASQAAESGKTLTIENPYVVNGLQTS